MMLLSRDSILCLYLSDITFKLPVELYQSRPEAKEYCLITLFVGSIAT